MPEESEHGKVSDDHLPQTPRQPPGLPDPPPALPFVQPSMGEPDLNFLNPPVSAEKTVEDILKELQDDG